MPSPFRADQLSPAMRERYGVGRRPVRTYVLVGAVIVAFAAAIAIVLTGWQTGSASGQVITWEAVADDHVHVVMRVQGAEQGATCVLRAQDFDHVDVGYAVLAVPAGNDVRQVEYELRTLAPAVNAEILGCSATGTPEVIGPQFPAGVVPPDQPYSE